MSRQTLKELLEPPFEIDMSCEGGIPRIYLDGDDKTYWVKVTTCRHDNRENAIDNQLKENADWIAAALNEKAERDFGEPLRWETDGEYIVHKDMPWYFCPKCERGKYIDIVRLTAYCPNCGQRLLPPEKTE